MLVPTGFSAWLLELPLWLIALAILVLMVAASRMGAFVRARAATGDDKDKDGEDQEGYILSAVAGLLALLMGFTFSMAVDRFDLRRELVLEEANAIGTAYLRTQLLEEPHRARISEILKGYVDTRLALAGAHIDEARPLLAANDQQMDDLWRAVMAAFPTIRGFDFSSSYLDSVNAVIDLSTSRKAARAARVPPEILVVLCIYVIVMAGVQGYTLKGRRRQVMGIFLFALFTMSLLLIIDIDRPASGGINESQLPMQLLKDSFRTDFSKLPSP